MKHNNDTYMVNMLALNLRTEIEALELDGCADDSIIELGNAVNNYCKKNNLHNE